jgi:hypothetical protein
MKGDMLTPQQIAQLKHLSSPIRVECHRGTVRAGPNQQQVCINYYLKAAALLLNVLERQEVSSQPAYYSMLLYELLWYVSKSVLYDLFLYLLYHFVSTG